MNKLASGVIMEDICLDLEKDIKMVQMFFLKVSSPFV